jgi:uncharacterized membrane protein
VNVERPVRIAVLGTTALLVALFGGWIVGASPSLVRVMLALLATLPLWAFVPSLSRGKRRSYAALTLCLVLYLTWSLTELVANPSARIWASSTLLLSFILFILLIVYLRATR